MARAATNPVGRRDRAAGGRASSQSLFAFTTSANACRIIIVAGSKSVYAWSGGIGACSEIASAYSESVDAYSQSMDAFITSVIALSASIHAFSRGIGSFSQSMAADTAFYGQYRPGFNRFRAAFQDCGGGDEL